MADNSVSENYENYFELRQWDKNTSEENFWYYDQLKVVIGLGGNKRVLEIGFGDGRFLDWCRARQLVSTGIEILPAALAKARISGHEVFEGPMTASTLPEDRRFDVIAAFDVVEHLTVSEIRQLFRDTFLHLAPNGVYLLRFPNGNSPLVGHTQTGDVTHRTLVSPGLIEDIVMPLGLKVERAFNDRMLPRGAGLQQSVCYRIHCVVLSRLSWGLPTLDEGCQWTPTFLLL